MVHQLLATLLSIYPAQLAWSVVPAALSTVAERKKHGDSIVAQARHKLMGQQQKHEQMGEQVQLDILVIVATTPAARRRRRTQRRSER